MAETAMVMAMLMMLFLALVSICLWVYGRVLLTAAAAEAARYVANADVGGGAAAQKRVQASLADGPLAGVSGTASCDATVQGLLVTVTCTMASPGVVSFLDGVLPDITVTGHSVEEDHP